ncbi:type II toxin-antitoxin system VapC family toxin [Dyadobacter subterraneus]|uniref:PIN domain-containing protein n=1 Tax=Dyadobacter subterraneus TaxID=2773304 RepID=A0ABR9WBT8_9BACT|nr:PIN domain-containing protein [Dyadobacter subterraneus]MBE9462902.1 PIN domain-containing protein [Dyadobacter subterraneus]
MNVFLDANVLISVVNKEQPLFSYSSRILSLAGNPKFILYTSAVWLAITYYFSEKKSGNNSALVKIKLLADHIQTAPVTHREVLAATLNKSIHDFEDGLQYYAALHAGCTCIVTENITDFYFSEIEVIDCKTFFSKYMTDKKS